MLGDADGVADFARQKMLLRAKDLCTGPISGVPCTLHVLRNCQHEIGCLYRLAVPALALAEKPGELFFRSVLGKADCSLFPL